MRKFSLFLLAAVLLASGCGDRPEHREILVGGIEAEAAPESAWQETEVVSPAPEVLAAEEPPPEEPVGEETPEAYARSVLSEEVQTVYDEILRCIVRQEEETPVSTLDPEVLDLAWTAVHADHGELFWVSGYVYTKLSVGGTVTELSIAPKYTMSQGERTRLQEQIDQAVDALLSGLPEGAGDYEKSRYVYETLASQVSYRETAEESQNIISALLYQETVCQGYANATQYLLSLLGVESFVVTGRTRGENHAWNCAKLDGEYYYLDTTFGNAAYTGDEEEAGYVNYGYLNITGEELSATHEPEVGFPLPDCTAVQDNYFIREGLYFDTWEPEALGRRLSAVWETGGGMASFKFARTELYDQAFRWFVTEQHIVEHCPEIASFRYVDDPRRAILMIEL